MGNQEDYENDEDMIPILFVGFPPVCSYLDQSNFRDMCERIGGPVKSLSLKQVDLKLRSYILVEFEYLQDAKRCRRKLVKHKLQFLGNKKCDVAILSRLKNQHFRGALNEASIN